MLVGQPRPGGTPGTINRLADGTYIYVCPCSCGNVYRAAGWSEKGSLEAGTLTLTPSLDHSRSGRCQWHGFLTGGVFR